MRNNAWTATTLVFATFLHPIVAFAGVADGSITIPVSEPETLALLAIGAVAIIVARWAKRK
jgi:PEP-CTERM motif-containing protein